MISAMSREQGLSKHMISAMSKLLRLKQACCHSSLVKKKINVENWDEFKVSLSSFLRNASEEWKRNR
jgi:hypothetical protein